MYLGVGAQLMYRLMMKEIAVPSPHSRQSHFCIERDIMYGLLQVRECQRSATKDALMF